MNRTSSSARHTASRKSPPPQAHAHHGDGPHDAQLLPLDDLRRSLQQLKLPQLDLGALIDSRRRDLEALLTAHDQAYRGIEAVTRRQVEMFSATLKALRAAATADTPPPQGLTERASQALQQAQEAYAQALANLKELAEISARSQQQVMDTLNKRLREGLREAGDGLGLKP